MENNKGSVSFDEIKDISGFNADCYNWLSKSTHCKDKINSKKNYENLAQKLPNDYIEKTYEKKRMLPHSADSKFKHNLHRNIQNHAYKNTRVHHSHFLHMSGFPLTAVY